MVVVGWVVDFTGLLLEEVCLVVVGAGIDMDVASVVVVGVTVEEESDVVSGHEVDPGLFGS
jgi:hypothetical protein